jgi:hypothetical protein
MLSVIFKLSCLGPLRINTQHNPKEPGKTKAADQQGRQKHGGESQAREPQRREREKQE